MTLTVTEAQCVCPRSRVRSAQSEAEIVGCARLRGDTSQNHADYRDVKGRRGLVVS